jgi:hypothetical protein
MLKEGGGRDLRSPDKQEWGFKPPHVYSIKICELQLSISFGAYANALAYFNTLALVSFLPCMHYFL